MAKGLIRSQLANTAELQAKLNKIKNQKVVIEMGSARFNLADCTNVAIDPSAANDAIQFQRPGGSSVENYELSDIESIRRLRSKKYCIKLKQLADPETSVE
jgi:hypothetical protein